MIYNRTYLDPKKEKLVEEVSNDCGIDKLLVRILLDKGFTPDEAVIILKDRYKGIIKDKLEMKNAVDIIEKYIRDEKSRIYIFGDYDVDGITSGYIMYSAISEIKDKNVFLYCPERVEGYGVNMQFCKKLIDSKDSFSKTLLITVDNGIAKYDEIQMLLNNNIDVIITDHHIPKQELPNCICIDPFCENRDIFRHLAGCGVAFKVAEEIQQRCFNLNLGNLKPGNMKRYTPYLAMGTMADMMPMNIENIVFCEYGIDIINSKNCPLSIENYKRYYGKKYLTSYDISWDICSKINACSRMGDIDTAVDFISIDENTTEDEANSIIDQIEVLNAKREELSKTAKKSIEGLDFSDTPVCLVECTEKDMKGMAGSIAQKVQEKFHKPAIVISKDGNKYSGSMRSNVDITSILNEEVENGDLISFGGHKEAGGLVIDENKIDKFKENLCNEILKIPEKEPKEEEIIIEDEITPQDLCDNFYKFIYKIPYNDSDLSVPYFILKDFIIEKAAPVKSNPNNLWITISSHNRIYVIRAVGLAQKFNTLKSLDKISFLGKVRYNFLYGRVKNQRQITFDIIDFLDNL